MGEPKIGLYVPKGDLPVEEKLRVIRNQGYDFVCTGIEKVLADGAAFLKICEKLGLPFENVHLTGDRTNLIWGADAEADEICRRYCDEIRIASELGIHTGIVHVTWGKSVTPENPGPLGFARYEKIGETAAKYGFTVCVENSIFPDHFFSVLNRFTGPEFGHCFDCGHWNAFMRDQPVIETYGPRLAATHIHDNDGHHDLHILPFDGNADWDHIAELYASCAFSREKICSECAGTHSVRFKNADAEKIDRILSRLKIYGTDAYRTEGDTVYFYEKYSYEEMVAVLYERMKRLAGMVAAKADGKKAAETLRGGR